MTAYIETFSFADLLLVVVILVLLIVALRRL